MVGATFKNSHALLLLSLLFQIRSTQGQGVMPDGTSRFSINGQTIYHFMGCSSFSEYTVVAEISCAKIADDASLEEVGNKSSVLATFAPSSFLCVFEVS